MPSIADLLRREIKHSDMSLNALAKASGVLQPALWRFVNDKVDPKLEAAEKLLDYFGYIVVKKGDGHAASNQLSTKESSKSSKRQPAKRGQKRRRA